MSNQNDISDDDRELFRDAASGSRRLEQDKIAPHRKRPSPRPQKRLEDEAQVMQDAMADPPEYYEVETGEELLYQRNGVQKQVMRKLKKGQISIEAELDLHRMTSDQAKQALQLFLRNAQQSHKRCVRIIHGKGHGSKDKKPVLKTKVSYWLKQRNEVLAFCSAPAFDGGTGAVYVLLKRL
jgi:DNA-nicking Smr family endonuclease